MIRMNMTQYHRDLYPPSYGYKSVTPTGYAQVLFIQNAFDGGTVLSLDTDFLPDHPLVSSQYSVMAQMIHPPNNNNQ